jgi:hypothetical protein
MSAAPTILGWALYYQNPGAVTARAETQFHKPIEVGTKVIVKAWVVKRRRRLFDAHAEIRIDGPENSLPEESDATMFLIDRTREKSANAAVERSPQPYVLLPTASATRNNMDGTGHSSLCGSNRSGVVQELELTGHGPEAQAKACAT